MGCFERGEGIFMAVTVETKTWASFKPEGPVVDTKLPGLDLKPGEVAADTWNAHEKSYTDINVHVDSKTQEFSALSTTQDRLKDLAAVLEKGRGVRTSAGKKQDVFESRVGATFTNDGSNGVNHVSITASPGATKQTFALQIKQIATQDTIFSSASNRVLSKTTALNLTDGNLIINNQNVAVTSSMTLEDLRDAINTQAGVSAKVSASIVEGTETTEVLGVVTHTTVYRLELTSTADNGGEKLTLSDNQGEAILGGFPLANNKYTPMRASGDFTVGGVTVSVTSAMTIYDVRNAINSAKNTGVQATVDTLTTGDLRLRLVSTETGKSIALANTVGTPLATLGLSVSGKSVSDLSAIYTLNGRLGSSASNTITTLEGVELRLLTPTTGTQLITGSIENNLQGIASTMDSFVSVLKDIHSFLKEQTKRDAEGVPDPDAYLAQNKFAKKFMLDFQSLIELPVPGLTGTDGPRMARDIGISFAWENGETTLKVDQKKLYSAIECDPDGMRRFLAFDFQSSGDVYMLKSPQKLDDSFQGKDIQLSLTKVTAGSGTNVHASFVVEGIAYAGVIDTTTRTVTGLAGGPFEHTTMAVSQSLLDSLVTDGVAQTRTFSVRQGMFDRVGNLLDNALAEDGDFAKAQSTTIGEKKVYEDQVTKLKQRATKAYEDMLSSFERIRGMLEKLENVRQQIDMLINYNSNR